MIDVKLDRENLNHVEFEGTMPTLAAELSCIFQLIYRYIKKECGKDAATCFHMAVQHAMEETVKLENSDNPLLQLLKDAFKAARKSGDVNDKDAQEFIKHLYEDAEGFNDKEEK